MKRLLKVMLAILIAILVIGCVGVIFLSRGLNEGKQLVISDVDLSAIADGVYTGTYHAGRWSNEIRVEIRDHQITGLHLMKDVTFKKPEVTDALFDQVIQSQRLNIDTIAGATVTSKAYLKAMESALLGNEGMEAVQ